MKISPARVAAFEVLLRIETERAFSSVLLPEFERNLAELDRRLCHQLTLGVLRQQIYLDRVIDHFTEGKKIDTAVRVILRLGLYQLDSLDKIPPHSAVSQSVLLVQRAKKSSAKGFVNAVLRRFLREGFTARYDDEIERISVETSHPRWLIERWAASFWIEHAEAFARSNNEIPPVAFRYANDSAKVPAINARKSEYVAGCFLADKYTSAIIEAAEKGEIYLQDEGSQIVGGTVALSESASFLDVCAAPGSKVTQIASRATGSDNLIIAGEFHAHRAAFLLENCRKQGLDRVSVVQFDAVTAIPFRERAFDAVLVDAPCSGTGTIRHNPEIRYFLSPADIKELSKKQRAILCNASKLVKKGGSIVYSTCSVENEENESVAAVLDADRSFKRVAPSVAGVFLADDGFGRTYPNRGRMDGFFIAKYVRMA
jgi:16S rRNA (cytosine967-C5)-methyltransferase